MISGYIFIGACFTLMALALGVLTREVFAERARRRNSQASVQDFTEKPSKSITAPRGPGYGGWPPRHNAHAVRGT